MNWKAIFALSIYGIVTAVGLGLGWFPQESLLFRVGIPLSLSLWVGIKIPNKQFLHGFLVGFIGEDVKWLTVFLLFPTYLTQNLPVALKGTNYLWGHLTFDGIHIGIWLGFLSWIVADLKPYFGSTVRQIKEKNVSLSLINVFYAIASLLSFFASIIFFFMLLASCAGHPPWRFLGFWIIPIYILGIWGSYRLGKLLLKTIFRSCPSGI